MASAIYYSKLTEDDINTIVVVPPYEPKQSISQWVRGAIKFMNMYSDVVITGPCMRVVYSGCRWNKLIMTGDNMETFQHFCTFLRNVEWVVNTAIWSEPEKYKPNAKSNTRFLFDPTVVPGNSSPQFGPPKDEIRCRLSVKRSPLVVQEGGDDSIVEPDTDFFVEDENGVRKLHPSEIQNGWKVIPVIRFSYYRNIERFGLVLTVLKAKVIPCDNSHPVINNEDWEMDCDNV